MAGHAPDFHPQSSRVRRWLGDLSDGRISLYMLIIALATAAAILAIDARFLN